MKEIIFRSANRKHRRPFIIFAALLVAVILGLVFIVVYEAAFTDHPRPCSALQGAAAVNCIEGLPPT